MMYGLVKTLSNTGCPWPGGEHVESDKRVHERGLPRAGWPEHHGGPVGQQRSCELVEPYPAQRAHGKNADAAA